jgi:hypothetical protein
VAPRALVAAESDDLSDENPPDPEVLAVSSQGAPSAAEELFGDDLPRIQAELSGLVAAKYHYLIEMSRAAQEAAQNK